MGRRFGFVIFGLLLAVPLSGAALGVNPPLFSSETWPNPRMEVSPSSWTVALFPGQATTRTLSIRNTGDTDLSFTIAAYESRRETIPKVALLSTGPAKPRLLSTDSENTIVLEYAFEHPAASKRGEYDLLSIAGLESSAQPGAPLVPVRTAWVLLPTGRKVAAIRALRLGSASLPGSYYLAPGQPPRPLGPAPRGGPTAPDPAIYGANAAWPGKDFENLGVQSRRGYRILTLNLFPVQYTPAAGTAAFSPRIRVEVDLAALVDKDEKAIVRPTAETRARLALGVDNPPALETYPPVGALLTASEPLTSSSLPSSGPYEYVIITSPTLAAAPGPWNFQALCDRKNARSVTATLVTTDYIYSHYSGVRPDGKTDNPTRVRNFLIDAYQHWGTRFALLGGANTVIPSRYFKVKSYPGGDETVMPVDLYYGCVEPAACSFDEDHDGVYGEVGDGPGRGDVDLFAEIYMGRAAVENPAEVSSFVRKTLQYETSSGDYLSSVTMVGGFLGFGGVADFAWGMMEQIRLGGDYNGYFTRGFENQEIASFRRFNTSRNLYDTAQGWPDSEWKPADLIGLFETGTHVFNHLGHAGITSSMKLSTDQLPGLTNTDPFFVYSQGCDSGWFDARDCFAEVLTTVEHGAFATVMNARTGWGVEESTEGPSQRFNRLFWNSVLGEGVLEMGRANQICKEELYGLINEPCMRWCYYELTLFGDPETSLRFQLEAPWLSIRPKSGTVAPGGRADVDVEFLASSMGPGKYQANLEIRSNDKISRISAVPATLYVKTDDLFALPGETLPFLGPQGPPFELSPTSQTFTVTNLGVAALPWSARGDAPWLDLVPTGGTLDPGASTTVRAALNSNAEELPAGTHAAAVSFTNTANGFKQDRKAQLTVLERGPAASLAWSPIPSPQAVKGPFAAAITARDARGYTATSFSGTVGLLAAKRIQFQGNEHPSVLISEIDTSLQDCVEFTNVTSVPIDLSGWQVIFYDWNSWPKPQMTFTITTGTLCQPGDVFLLYDEGTAPGAYPVFYTGRNVFWNNSPYGNPVAVLLRDGQGNIADFACANDAVPSQITQPIPIPPSEWWGPVATGPAQPGQSMQRGGNSDRNDRFDWNVYPTAVGRKHASMELPYLALPVPLFMTPREALFVNGTWSGLATVREEGLGIRIRARTPGKTLEALSNVFDVTPYAGYDGVILNHLLGIAPLSEADQHRFDVNGDGALNVADLTFLRNYEKSSLLAETSGSPKDSSLTALAAGKPLPDLLVSSVGWTAEECTDAQVPELSFEAVNAGSVPSPECRYEILSDKAFAARGTLAPIAPDGERLSLEHISLLNMPPGLHSIQVSLDVENAVDEVKEGNNSRAVSLPVRIGPRTLEAGSRRVSPLARQILVPVLLSRAGNAAGINLQIETDPAVFEVADVSVPDASPLGPELHWRALSGGITNLVVFLKPDAAFSEQTLGVVILRLDVVCARTPGSSAIHLRAGAVGDVIGNASRSLTLKDALIEFGTGATDWSLYDRGTRGKI